MSIVVASMKICGHRKWETMDNNGCPTQVLVTGYVGKGLIMQLMFSLFGNDEIDDLKQPVKTSLRSVFSWLSSVINFIIPSKLNINTLLSRVAAIAHHYPLGLS